MLTLFKTLPNAGPSTAVVPEPFVGVLLLPAILSAFSVASRAVELRAK
jgi:hypothetical protein